MKPSRNAGPFLGLTLIAFRRKYAFRPDQRLRVDAKAHRVASWPFPRPDGRVGLMVARPGEPASREIILSEHRLCHLNPKR